MTTNNKIRWDNAVWAAHFDKELLKQHKVSEVVVKAVAFAHATRGVDFDSLRVWFAVDTIATLTGVSEKQVRQARKVLLAIGAFIEDGYHAIPGGKGKRTRRFYLNPAALEGTATITAPSEAGNGNDDEGTVTDSEGTVTTTDNKNNPTSITREEVQRQEQVGADAPPLDDSIDDNPDSLGGTTGTAASGGGKKAFQDSRLPLSTELDVPAGRAAVEARVPIGAQQSLDSSKADAPSGLSVNVPPAPGEGQRYERDGLLRKWYDEVGELTYFDRRWMRTSDYKRLLERAA